MADEKELSPLEKANAIERDIALNGPKDPDKFKMPDGRTLSETRQQMYDDQVKEGQVADDLQQQRIREQSTEGDPLYHAEASGVSHVAGSVTLLPPPAPEHEEDKEVAEKESTPAAPPMSTMTPARAATQPAPQSTEPSSGSAGPAGN